MKTAEARVIKDYFEKGTDKQEGDFETNFMEFMINWHAQELSFAQIARVQKEIVKRTKRLREGGERE